MYFKSLKILQKIIWKPLSGSDDIYFRHLVHSSQSCIERVCRQAIKIQSSSHKKYQTIAFFMVGTLVFNGLNKVVVKSWFNFVSTYCWLFWTLHWIILALNLWNSFDTKKIKMHVSVPCGIYKFFKILEDRLTAAFAVWINEIDQFGKLLHGSKIKVKTNLAKKMVNVVESIAKDKQFYSTSKKIIVSWIIVPCPFSNN